MASKQLRDDLLTKFRSDIVDLMKRHAAVWSVVGITAEEKYAMVTATFIQILIVGPYTKEAILETLNSGYEEYHDHVQNR